MNDHETDMPTHTHGDQPERTADVVVEVGYLDDLDADLGDGFDDGFDDGGWAL